MTMLESAAMATLTIRNLDDSLKERLRVRAASHGHSMEEEARVILKQAVGGMSGASLWALSRELFTGECGIDLTSSERVQDRPGPDLGGDSK
jgi:plasmid stability protein